MGKYLNGDINKLKQVIGNFISNALKFTPSGGSVSVLSSWSDTDPLAPSDPHKTASFRPRSPRVRDGKKSEAYGRPGPTSCSKHGYLVLKVKDTGIGLSEVFIQQVIILSKLIFPRHRHSRAYCSKKWCSLRRQIFRTGMVLA